jgi:tetratricopeptide (TPR) repeat protein
MFRKSMIATTAACAVGIGSVALAMGSIPKQKAAPSPPAAETRTDYLADCLDGGSPIIVLENRAKAEKVVRACAGAIQSRTLTPTELAQARLNRGAARTALGDQILASGDYLEALRHYEGAINPLNPDALGLFRAGAALDGIGKADAALGRYSEAIKADPKLTLAYYARGVLLATRERAYARAIGDFDKVLVLEPANDGALVRRGEAYSQLGDFGHALADLNHAIELDPANPAAYVARGLANDRRGQTAKALEDFGAALRLNPHDIGALRNRGALRARLGQSDLAVGDFNAVIVLQPNDPIAFFNRGYAYFGKQQYDLAAIDYTTSIYFDPALGPAYLNRCLTRTVQGKDLVKALADCDHALKLMPLSIAARETRGFIYLKLGDAAIAIAEYEAALRMDANRPLALYGMGLAKIRVGRKAEGEADRAAALVLNPAITREFSIYGVE